ncbi:hypothetical protein DFH09DRAFT_1102754 [Mycena vulgaris]|nr:hypothetical protein DFH09DRAFT_1102754 [Mycena vulgaris]
MREAISPGIRRVGFDSLTADTAEFDLFTLASSSCAGGIPCAIPSAQLLGPGRRGVEQPTRPTRIIWSATGSLAPLPLAALAILVRDVFGASLRAYFDRQRSSLSSDTSKYLCPSAAENADGCVGREDPCNKALRQRQTPNIICARARSLLAEFQSEPLRARLAPTLPVLPRSFAASFFSSPDYYSLSGGCGSAQPSVLWYKTRR